MSVVMQGAGEEPTAKKRKLNAGTALCFSSKHLEHSSSSRAGCNVDCESVEQSRLSNLDCAVRLRIADLKGGLGNAMSADGGWAGDAADMDEAEEKKGAGTLLCQTAGR
eukprot:1472364-Rhodomonas_salina.1